MVYRRGHVAQSARARQSPERKTKDNHSAFALEARTVLFMSKV